MIYQNPIFWGILVLVGLVAGYFIRQLIVAKQSSSIEQKIRHQLEEAKVKTNEIILDAQKKAAGALEEIKKEEREQKFQLRGLEERLLKKEEHLEKQSQDLRSSENQLKEEAEKIKIAKSQLVELKQKLASEF